MTKPARRRVLAALALFGTSALAGCSVPGTQTSPPAYPLHCPAKPASPLTLVVGARANSPAPAVPTQIQDLISAAAAGGAEIQAVRLDGVPSFAFKGTFSSTAQNTQMRNRDLNAFVSGIGQNIAALRPAAAQADVLGALSEAAKITAPGGTIVLIDSGLPTAGAVDYLDPDMWGADPAEVASFLKAQQLLPALAGKALVLVDVGDTAQPQAALPQNLSTRLVQLWTTIAKAAHADCVQDLQTGVGRTSVATGVAVSAVPLPPMVSIKDCGSTVLGDAGSVGFIVGKARFRDPAAAAATLAGLVRLLKGDDDLVTLTGSTSSEGDPGFNQALSVQRAQAVADVLTNQGVDGSRITVVGVGSHGPGHIVDMTKQGALIPAAAEHNRSVTVTLRCAAR